MITRVFSTTSSGESSAVSRGMRRSSSVGLRSKTLRRSSLTRAQLPLYDVMPNRDSSSGTCVCPSGRFTSSVTCTKNTSGAYSRVSNTMRYTPGSRSRASSRTRPSPSVLPVAITFASRCVSRRTRRPAAGLPVVVSSTCVESDPFAIGGVSYARYAHASHHRGQVHVQSATRRRESTEDMCRDARDTPVPKQARARALERRGDLGADGRPAPRHRFRESDEPSRARTGARLSGRHLGDGDPLPVRLDALREQGRAARGQSLRDRCRGEREPRGGRPAHALGG